MPQVPQQNRPRAALKPSVLQLLLMLLPAVLTVAVVPLVAPEMKLRWQLMKPQPLLQIQAFAATMMPSAVLQSPECRVWAQWRGLHARCQPCCPWQL